MICLLGGNTKDLNFQGYCQGNLWGAQDGIARKATAGASHPAKNYCLITGWSKSGPNTQAGGKSIWSSCSRMWLSEQHLAQKPKTFLCGYAYLAINEYTETEITWVGKAPVPYEIIHDSILLVPLFCCCFSSCCISAREWGGWEEGGLSPMAAPLCKGEVGRKEKGKQLSLLGPLHHHHLLTHRFAYLNEQSQKNKACSCICRFAMWICAISSNPPYPRHSVCKMELRGAAL